jgi:hypothetical protein
MNNKIKIFTLSAKAEHGKNFTADIISSYYKEEYNKQVCQLANGDYLKFLSKLAGWDGSKGEKGRQFLQEFGTEYIRNEINEDFWVDEVIKQIEILSRYYDRFVITDTRFPNEIAKLEEIFGAENVINIRVVRYDDINGVYEEHKSNLTEEQLNHPSETALNDYVFDYVLINHVGQSAMLCFDVARTIKASEVNNA